MRRRASLVRPENEATGQAGTSVIELVITSALLLIALTALFSGLDSSTRTASYAERRNRALDDLRLMTANFSKDVRSGARVTAFDAASVSMDTYVDGALTSVTWQASGDSLERQVAGGVPRVFVIDLTTSSVFSYYDETRPELVNRIRLNLATRPDPDHPAIEVETNVEMRNA